MIQGKFRFVVVVSLLLILGFSLTSLTAYLVAKNVLQDNVRSEILPLSSDNIYSEIQRDILPTVVISSLMAQDTFVRDWIINGEKNPEKIVRYLKSIQERYDTDTAFFISDATHTYYHSSGNLRQVKKDDTKDSWYFRVKGLTDDFEINIDNDATTPNQTTVFVNYKINDYQDRYLGTIGVGLSTAAVIEMIEKYQSRYNRQVYFVEANGKVALHGKGYNGADNVYSTPGFSDIASKVMRNKSGSYIYHNGSAKVFVNARHVKELNWYLIVEQIDRSESQMKNTFLINLFISLVVGIIILVLTLLTVGGYQRRLESMATKDKLTGVNNRHTFELISRQLVKVVDRSGNPLSAVLIDIDHFKNINDRYGHLAGDQVIIKVANILKDYIRDSDLICRWGGEEFIILLPGSDREKTRVWAEKIRQSIENNTVLYDEKTISVTASFGISCYLGKESQDTFFTRLDTALYQAKNKGRNRVEIA